MIRLKPINFEYDAFEYTEYNSLDDVIAFIEKHNCKYLYHVMGSKYISIHYEDNRWQETNITFQKGWYFWFDDAGILNAASPEYIKDYFEVYEYGDD